MKAKAMSIRNKDCMIWSKNKKWYYVDEALNRFVLTPEAPKEARDSFEKYKKLNHLNW